MAKKHPFHCENCESECIIYKKGKSHRVLVCPNCGVLATNGKGLLRKVAKIGAGFIPGVGGLVSAGIDMLPERKEKSLSTSPRPQRAYNPHSLDKIKLALGGK